MLRNHGRKDKYDHEIPGFNVRFNEIKAAIGRVMLKHLDGFNDNRRAIAARYNERLKPASCRPRRARMGQGRSITCTSCALERRDELQKVPQGKRHRHRHPLSRAQPSAAGRHGRSPHPAPAATPSRL
jgi:dTDP-4-amino-4,6-dideoxygalactose transaminase